MANKVVLTKRVRHKAVPQLEELLSLARVESGAHQLYNALVVLDERLMQPIALVVVHLVLQLLDRFMEPEFEQILKDGAVDVLLARRELVEVHGWSNRVAGSRGLLAPWRVLAKHAGTLLDAGASVGVASPWVGPGVREVTVCTSLLHYCY